MFKYGLLAVFLRSSMDVFDGCFLINVFAGFLRWISSVIVFDKCFQQMPSMGFFGVCLRWIVSGNVFINGFLRGMTSINVFDKYLRWMFSINVFDKYLRWISSLGAFEG